MGALPGIFPGGEVRVPEWEVRILIVLIKALGDSMERKGRLGGGRVFYSNN